jgi:2-keto-4-pentenoate hydratase/2-oxohepta-3-ene-1,7-dioic acid hydratase in catechol pathway
MTDGGVRIVRVAVDGVPRWGVVDGPEVVELTAPPWGGVLRRGASLGALSALRLLAPTCPTKVVCVGRNYVEHAAEHGVEVPAEPLLFFKPPSSVVGPGDAIVLPPESERVEHEGELAVVIGRRCRRVAAADAWGVVLGVTCGDDVTARDLQRRDGQWTRGKGFDTFCPLGPWVVSGLEEGAVSDLEVSCRVNGSQRQSSRTRHMVFPPAVLVEYITAVMTLEPGDVIMTGTPAGVGPLVAGDVVEVEVEDVGVLANPVVTQSSAR